MTARTTLIIVSLLHEAVVVFAIFAVGVACQVAFVDGGYDLPGIVHIFESIGWLFFFVPLVVCFVAQTKWFKALKDQDQVITLLGFTLPVTAFAAFGGIISIITYIPTPIHGH